MPDHGLFDYVEKIHTEALPVLHDHLAAIQAAAMGARGPRIANGLFQVGLFVLLGSPLRAVNSDN